MIFHQDSAFLILQNYLFSNLAGIPCDKLAFFGIILSTLVESVQVYAVKQYSAFDTITSLVAFFMAAFPAFVLGLMFLYIFALKLNLLPSYGIATFRITLCPPWPFPFHKLQEYAIYKVFNVAIRQDYVRTAPKLGAHRHQSTSAQCSSGMPESA